MSDIVGLEATFGSIQSSNVKPSNATYNILVNAYIDANLDAQV